MTLRRALLALAALLILGLAVTGWSYRTALSDPVVRRAEIALPGLTAPVRAVLISDLHVAAPDMPPERLQRIVAQIDALRPDIVLIGGDFIGDGRLSSPVTAEEAIRPLAALRPRFGTIAVLGNHDYWNDAAAVRDALARAGIRLLMNDAVAAGPLAVGGLDDDFTGRSGMARTLRRLRSTPGARLMLSHSPDPFAGLPGDVTLMLAGHTHCGQIRLPLFGAFTYESRYGSRFGCGLVEEEGRTLIVTAGLGTSVLPLRLGAVPDLWLLELRPAPARPPR